MREIDRSTSGRAATTVGEVTRVLVVAEGDDFTRSLRSRLQACGCVVDIASTPGEAVTMAEGAYELILLDLEPSDLDSLAALRALKSAAVAVECPVVLIKGEREPAHVIQRGLDLGAAGYLNKHRLPVTLEMSTLLQTFGVERVAARAHARKPRSDACPHSASGTFHECSAFVPVNALGRTDAGMERVSCSRLRAGAADTWRLYPRCALGDAAARVKYVRDQGL